MKGEQSLFRLEVPIRKYAWGSHESLARIRGAAFPTADPEAELWIGAHDSDPARVPNLGPLNELIAAEPDRFLGERTNQKFGARLPFLLKLLAVEKPLSLQVHPTREQARLGFADENKTRIPIGSPDRTFIDENHKPELIVAISDFRALVGFRKVEEITRLAEEFVAYGATSLASRILAPLRAAPDKRGLHEVLKGLVGQPDDAAFVAQTVQAALGVSRGTGEFAATARWLIDVAGNYPVRPDVVVMLLLNLFQLSPGEAVYVAPGQVHAYLDGLTIEIMASSDNVLRGGLTAKHVDVPAFLAMVDCTPGSPSRFEGVVNGPITSWTPPIDDFLLRRIECGAGYETLEVATPLVLFAISNSATISRGPEILELRQGESAFVAPGSPIVLAGGATLWGASCR